METAWERVRRSARPLARDRAPVPERSTRSVCPSTRRVARAEGGRRRRGRPVGARDRVLGRAVPGSRRRSSRTRASLRSTSRGSRGAVATHPCRAARRRRRCPSSSASGASSRLERDGWIVGFGGGSTTDVAGFVAATYLRGVRWIAVPTTLVGQVDAAIGGKTAIDLAEGKNLVGRVPLAAARVRRPRPARTLPDEERRDGLAEVVKTGLLAGEELWELPDAELVRALRRLQVRGRACATRTTGGAADDPESRAHVRARARGRRRLRAAARRRRRARPARGAAPLRPTRPTSSRTCSRPSRCASTAIAPGPPSAATRRPRAAGRLVLLERPAAARRRERPEAGRSRARSTS